MVRVFCWRAAVAAVLFTGFLVFDLNRVAQMRGATEGQAILLTVRVYLDITGIIDVARRHGVDAIHPGYGFLSENPELARACRQAGITFVGPRVELLEKLGLPTSILAEVVTPGTFLGPLLASVAEPRMTIWSRD